MKAYLFPLHGSVTPLTSLSASEIYPEYSRAFVARSVYYFFHSHLFLPNPSANKNFSPQEGSLLLRLVSEFVLSWLLRCPQAAGWKLTFEQMQTCSFSRMLLLMHNINKEFEDVPLGQERSPEVDAPHIGEDVVR